VSQTDANDKNKIKNPVEEMPQENQKPVEVECPDALLKGLQKIKSEKHINHRHGCPAISLLVIQVNHLSRDENKGDPSNELFIYKKGAFSFFPACSQKEKPVGKVMARLSKFAIKLKGVTNHKHKGHVCDEGHPKASSLSEAGVRKKRQKQKNGRKNADPGQGNPKGKEHAY
jgi:hypothetical protein